MIATILVGAASALATLFSINCNTKYKKAKKVLEAAEKKDLMSPKTVMELIESTKQKQDCYISGNIKSISTSNKVFIGKCTKNILPNFAYLPGPVPAKSSFSSKFLLQDDDYSIPVCTYQNTVSLGSKLREQKSGILRIALTYGAFALSICTSLPIPLLNLYCTISEGEYITAFGTVSYNIRTGGVEMNKVKGLFKGSRKDLIRYFRREMRIKWLSSILSKVAAGVLIGSFGLYAYELIRGWRARRPVRENREQVLSVNSLVCLICKANCSTVTYKDCDHLAVCEKCDREKMPMNCPRCNKLIREKSVLYLP